MRSRIVVFFLFFSTSGLVACDADPASRTGTGGAGGAEGGAIGATAGTPGSAGGSAGGATVAAGGATGAADAADSAGGAGGGATLAGCTAARGQLIGAVNTVATGAVTLTDTTAGVLTLIVDATAGGPANAATNPWIFVELQTGTKVPVTDVTATTSTAWDLALKRASLFTNGGQGGPGQGGAALLAKDFALVTAADVTATALDTEMFFDAACTPNLDPTGAAVTTFSTWYAYDEATHMLSPAPGTWLVRGGAGRLYKVQFLNYYAPAPGGASATGASATYQLKVAAL